MTTINFVELPSTPKSVLRVIDGRAEVLPANFVAMTLRDSTKIRITSSKPPLSDITINSPLTQLQVNGTPITDVVDAVKELNEFLNFNSGGGASIKNALLKLSPHLWETDVEYDFEDGSYGRRFVGTTPLDFSSTAYQVMLYEIIISKLLLVGGFFQTKNVGSMYMINSYATN